MNAVPETSGVDLARQACSPPTSRQGRTAPSGRTSTGAGPGSCRATERPARPGRGDQHDDDPGGLVAQAAGGSILAQWETILAAAAPEEIVNRYELRCLVAPKNDRHSSQHPSAGSSS
ncbi:hypothetical protein [Streptomyces sp. NPDC090135]|uniref:hypothetical protein n=1 Tax=Streptomyces sp. NPDC090135 TaxID=3365957 RepID=UPI0037FF5CBB